MTTVPLLARPAAPARRIPGEGGIWLFISGEVVMFSLLFCIFLLYRERELDVFASSHAHLNQSLGMFNTLLMLSSSWLVALAVQAARRNLNRATPLLLLLAFMCGAGFGIVKMIEYSEKIRAGMTLTTNDFFMYYFMFTGIHLMHVILGMAVLAFLVRATWSGKVSGSTLRNLESGASFWHLVDLLWIILFALFYPIK